MLKYLIWPIQFSIWHFSNFNSDSDTTHDINTKIATNCLSRWILNLTS